MDLITDRTKADVDLAASIAAKIKKGTATEAERQYYLYGETIPLECLDGPLTCTDGPITAGNGVTKGGYNDVDLNRVETAVQTLQGVLNTMPETLLAHMAAQGVAVDQLFLPPYYPTVYELETKTDWIEPDYPVPEQMTRYLQNVRTLRAALPLPGDLPELPDSMDDLDHVGANSIEETLLAVDRAAAETEAALLTLIDNTAAAFWYLGELEEGEE